MELGFLPIEFNKLPNHVLQLNAASVPLEPSSSLI